MIFNKPYIIAEIGVNYYDIAKKHNISLIEAAKLMIKEAKLNGSDAIKFQTYKAGKLASKNSPAYWDTTKEPTLNQYELFSKFDKFNIIDYTNLFEYSKSIGIDFLTTAFDIEALHSIDSLVKFHKIASADITNLPLIKEIVLKKKPILLSVGASTISEIKETVGFIKKMKEDLPLCLLHCVLSYPTLNENANLNRITVLKKYFPDLEIGYSDHTLPDENMVI